MSLNSKKKLLDIAKFLSRDLRKDSTNAELVLWNRLRNRKFHNIKFYRQYPIFYDVNGKESFFIADFYTHFHRLIIELDGPIHLYNKKYDQDRSELLIILSYNVLRFENVMVLENIEDVLRTIEESFNS